MRKVLIGFLHEITFKTVFLVQTRLLNTHSNIQNMLVRKSDFITGGNLFVVCLGMLTFYIGPHHLYIDIQ